MAVTRITDIIVPEVLGKMVPAMLTDHMDLMRLGFATGDYKNSNITDGGSFVNVPFYGELSGDDELMTDDTSSVPGKLSTLKDIGVVCHRIKSWGSRDLAKILSGDDSMTEAGRQLAKYWGYRGQQALINVLSGVFAATGPLGTGATYPHVTDVAVTESTAVKLSATQAIATLQLMGQYFTGIDGWIMHSKVFLDLEAEKLITYSETKNPDDLVSMWRQPSFLGKPVVISDDVPVDTTTANYFKYTTYGLGKGSLYFGTQKKMNPETDRDVLAKEDVLSCDFHFVPHLKLVKWGVATENPTNAQLATATNWTLIAENHKFVKAIAIITN